MPTTMTLIVAQQRALIEALSPTALNGTRFRAEKGEADFRAWATANPASSFRRFAIRDVGVYTPPTISDHTTERTLSQCEVTVAYPSQWGLYGIENHDDADDIIRQDGHLIDKTIGHLGAANYVSGQHSAVASTGWTIDRNDPSVMFAVLTLDVFFDRTV